MGNNASRDAKLEGKGDRRKRLILSHAVNKVTNNFATSSVPAPTVVSRPTPIGHRVVLHDQATPLSTLTGLNIPRATTTSGYEHSRGSSMASEDISPLSTPPSNSLGSLPRTFGSDPGSLIVGDEMGYLILEGKRPSDRRLPRAISPNTAVPVQNRPSIFEYQGAKESDRQQRQHYLFKRIFNGNYAVPLEKPSCILDSGCGTGLWTQEMSQQFPNANVVGLDLIPPVKHARSKEDRLMYLQGDINKDLGFADNAFDFVYQRDMATIVPAGRWPTLIQDFARILKPGGWLQLVEYDLPFKCPGPVLSLINDWFESASSTLGINPRYTASFNEYLRDACFQDIHEETYDIPIGEWPDDPKQKEFGFLYREHQKTLFKSMKKWWLEEIHASSEDYDRVCQEALKEFDEYHSFARWRVFTARKPLHVVLASTLACNIIYEISRVISRQMFPKTFKTFRGFNEANWNIHVVSTIHCLVVIAGAFMILHDDELSKDRIFGYSPKAANFYSISCGYFLWDMVTAIRYIKHQGIGMAFHGVASFAVFILSFRPFLNYYGAVFILYELSTPFLNFNWFMDKLGWTGSKIQLLNGLVLICAFFGARLVYGMRMSYQTWVEVYAVRDQVPILYMVVYGTANVILNSLNVYWFGLMIRMLVRRFSGKKPAPRVQ